MQTQQPVSTNPAMTGPRTDVRAALLGGKTFRSLSEQTLSPREEKFERARMTSGFILAPLVTIVFALIPMGLSYQQHMLAAILLGVIVLWITEPVPIPIGGLIGVGAVVVLGIVRQVHRPTVAAAGSRRGRPVRASKEEQRRLAK